MQIPHLSKIKEVETNLSLKPGQFVSVRYEGAMNEITGFKVVSLAKTFSGKTLVLTKDSTTLVIAVTNLNGSVVRECTRIDNTVYDAVISEINIRDGASRTQVSLDFTYKGVEKQNVLTPLAPGDTLETANKKFIVEYIASDGSIVAKVEGKSQAKLTTECVMINPKDASILKALFTRPVWK